MFPPAVGLTSNSQVNSPSSAVVTVKIFRVTLRGIQLKLNLEVKDPSTSVTSTDGIILATVASFNFKVRERNVRSVRLKFQLSGSLIDPSTSVMLCVRSCAGFVAVPTGGGSYQ